MNHCFCSIFLFASQSFRGIPQAVDLSYVSGSSGVRSVSISHVEAKNPALLFKQQLTAYVEKIYGMIRDNLKKELCPSLVSIIQVYSIEHTYGLYKMYVVLLSSSTYMTDTPWMVLKYMLISLS